MNATTPATETTGETSSPPTTTDDTAPAAAPPYEPAFLRAAFQFEIERGDDEPVTFADASVRVRLPSSDALSVVGPVLEGLLPFVSQRLGVTIATGGAHVAGCPNAPPPPRGPAFGPGAVVLVVRSPDAPELVGRTATVVARLQRAADALGGPIEPFEWLCDVDGYRAANLSTGPFFRTSDLSPARPPL